jgi:hypothetical protein
MPKSDPTVVTGEIVEQPKMAVQVYDDENWYLDKDVDNIEGYDLVKDEALFALVGVPFRITKFTFHEGKQQPGCAWRNDFVSAELRVFPLAFIEANMARIISRRTSDLILDRQAIAAPNEFLVINNGGTGFYRQVTEYLDAKGIIEIGGNMPWVGGKNQCRYDLPRSEWTSGEEVATEGIDVKFNCVRGLRYSDYTNEYTGDQDRAITWYIA